MKKIPQIIAQNLDGLFVVGGAVRDIILGMEPKEYDLITTTAFEKIKFKTFKESKTGETVGAFIKGVKYDISRYESLDYDLKRRDFTINSMAFPVHKNGEILIFHVVDPTNGIEDLKNKVLRSFNPYENIKSDPVRILRGLRFISNYDLDVEEKTFTAMKTFMPLVQKISKERLFTPLDGFVKGKYFSKASQIAKTLNLEAYLGIPPVNFEIADKVDHQCRWQAIFVKTKSTDIFKEKVFPPSKIIKSIMRINDFVNQIENQRYDWTIKIKDEETECLCQILAIFKIDPGIVRKRMSIKLEVTPEMLKKRNIEGKEIAKKMIEMWKDILNQR
ncbi:MAG: hypothetical protein M1542_00555 [Thermotogae bacterium]|jgi:tRNA nucleotidyltransferase/poly(A) polymerase|nr:hypothetical protein [Thermotogota bacterium]